MAPKEEDPEVLPKGIKKEVIRPADPKETLRPQKGDECQVHYVGRFPYDGEEFDNSRSRGQPLTITLGVGQVIKGWDLAVATMMRGELSRFTCSPEYAYGEKGAPPKIPPDATLIFEIELVSWRSDNDLFGDGGCIRTKVKEPTGYNDPAAGAEVLCSLKVTAADGRVLTEKPKLEYKIGSGSLGRLSRALDSALQDMRKGEVVSLQCSKEYSYGEEECGDVTVDLTLQEILETEDVSPGKDKSIIKKRIAEGDGYQKPKDGGKVHLTVEAVTSKGSGSPVNGFEGSKELHFVAGDGEVCDALEYAVLHMVKEERAIITCSSPSTCADAKLGLEGLTGSSEVVCLTVQLQNFDNGTASWEMTMEEKIAYASQRKEAGTRLFKAQRFGLASERYRMTAEFLRSYVGVPELGDEITRLCDLNRAACLLKLGDHSGAKAACTSVLTQDPKNVKALFRRATAYLELHEFSEALADLRILLEQDPENKEAQRLLQQATRGAKQEEKKASNMFAKMNKAFSGLADEEERRTKEKKEAKEAEIARKSAEAKAEAKKLNAQRGPRSAEACKEDLMRASQSINEMRKKCFEMEMAKYKTEDDD